MQNYLQICKERKSTAVSHYKSDTPPAIDNGGKGNKEIIFLLFFPQKPHQVGLSLKITSTLATGTTLNQPQTGSVEEVPASSG